MEISSNVILDSHNPKGDRLTTMVLTFPRIILAEFNTHRMFSRNASSSRAIPVNKMIAQVDSDPFIPVYWGKNKPGMQAEEEIVEFDKDLALESWLRAKDYAVFEAKEMIARGVHKQIANRLLEPWMMTKVICSFTDVHNFFALRDHEAAQPEMRELAIAMRGAYENSIPIKRAWGEWHLPFINFRLEYDDDSSYEENMDRLLKCSVARCARVSYLNHDGSSPSIEKDIKLHDDLVGSWPLHASPAEHQAYAYEGGRAGNFNGFYQYRKTLINENITTLPY